MVHGSCPRWCHWAQELPVWVPENSYRRPERKLCRQRYQQTKLCTKEKMLTNTFFRGSLRGFAIPHCPPLHLHFQQPQPLINLRSFSARGSLTSVLVRAQTATFAERSKPATSSFEQLGLGEELLSFLSEQHLTTPTEIQVGRMLPTPLHCQALA